MSCQLPHPHASLQFSVDIIFLSAVQNHTFSLNKFAHFKGVSESHCVVGIIMAPRRCSCPNPQACEYAVWCGKGELRLLIRWPECLKWSRWVQRDLGVFKCRVGSRRRVSIQYAWLWKRKEAISQGMWAALRICKWQDQSLQNGTQSF